MSTKLHWSSHSPRIYFTKVSCDIRKCCFFAVHFCNWGIQVSKDSSWALLPGAYKDFTTFYSQSHPSTRTRPQGYDYPIPNLFFLGNTRISPSPPDMWLDRPGQRARPESFCCDRKRPPMLEVTGKKSFCHWLQASLAFATWGQLSTWMTRHVAWNFKSKKIKEFEERRFTWNHVQLDNLTFFVVCNPGRIVNGQVHVQEGKRSYLITPLIFQTDLPHLTKFR